MPKRYNNYEGKSVNNKTGYAEIKNEETQSYTIENILCLLYTSYFYEYKYIVFSKIFLLMYMTYSAYDN